MELRDFEAFGEPGATVYLADCLDLMRLVPEGSVDAVFADPPYRLSNGGATVRNGRLASVDKGAWDRSLGFERLELPHKSARALPISSNVPSGWATTSRPSVL